VRPQRKAVLINLLSVRTGGQVTRAKAFLARVREHDPLSTLIVLQAASSSDLADYSMLDLEVVTIAFPFRRYIAFQRMTWENVFLPGLLKRLKIDTYISFSHYLPRTFPSSVYSLVGVSNLAPFSKAAWDAEGYWVKARMLLQKHAILSSVKRAATVLALSETCKEILVRNGIDTEDIFVSPNGVEQERCQGFQNNTLVRVYEIDQPYILYVSHFHRYKNHLRLIDAYSLLPETTRAAFKLVLVGEPFNRKYHRDVLERIDRTKLKGTVLVIPGLSREKLSVLYSNASLFAFPSLIENSPNILLEAMCFGLPILSSSFDPMPEFCGCAAVYFSPFSVTDMSNKLEWCLHNNDRMQSLRREAKQRSRRYSWDTFTENVTSLYLNRQ
jgi:glycosyltransferase involved in cell wall biosynthesis